MQDLIKAIHIATTKAVRIETFQLFYYCHYCIGGNWISSWNFK